MTAAKTLREAADGLERLERWPYGPQAKDVTWRAAGAACTALTGNEQLGRQLWLTIVEDLGYMPHASAVALIRASNREAVRYEVEPPAVT